MSARETPSEQLRRLVEVHEYVKKHGTLLPEHMQHLEEIEPYLLQRFMAIARNWQKGMKELAVNVNYEHNVVGHAFSNLIVDLDLPAMANGYDWRIETLDLSGQSPDDAPLDVQWSDDQIVRAFGALSFHDESSDQDGLLGSPSST